MDPPFPTPLCLAFFDAGLAASAAQRLVAGHDRGDCAGPFCHAELAFDHQPPAATLCFSSTFRDGGARFRRLDLTRGWTLLRAPATPADVSRLRAWCRSRGGGRYDLSGVLAFKLPLVRQRRTRWFCSELCAAALHHAGLLGDADPARLSPNALFHLCRRRFAGRGRPFDGKGY